MSQESHLAGAAPATNPRSEQRAAEIVIERFGDEIRYDASRGRFIKYAGGVWRDDPGEASVSGHVMTIARETAHRLKQLGVTEADAKRRAMDLQSAAGLRSVKALIRATGSVVVTSDQFDVDPFALNCRNGTVDLRTGHLRPHSPADMLSKQCPVNYDRDANCPTWGQHLQRIFAGDAELIRFLQQCAGLYASADIAVEELHVWYGKGSNGKSKTHEAIAHVLGDYADVAPEGLILERTGGAEHPTEIADLMGKRLVIASETEEGGRLRLSLVKRLTGDAELKARFMRQDYFKFRRTHKIVLCTNHRPIIEENTEAVWRRLRLIPFNVTIPPEERRTDIIDVFKGEEAAGILAWIVRGSVQRLDAPMNPPACVLVATNEYRASSDHFEAFTGERLVLEAGEKVNITRKELLETYAKWAVEAGEPETLNSRRIFDGIRQIPGVREGAWSEKDLHDNWVKRRGFIGIRKKQPYE